MNFSRIVIIEGSLKNTLGHYYEYVRSVSEAAARLGIPVTIVASRDVDPALRKTLDVLSVFRMTVHDKAVALPGMGKLGNRLNGLVFAIRFYRDWGSCSAARNLTPGTMVFIPTATEVGLLGLALWLRRRRLPENVRIFCLLRLEPHRFLRKVIGLLRRQIDRGAVVLTTDSDELTKAFGERTGIRFTTLPIPHVPDLRSVSAAKAGAGLGLLFPGGARDEKGIDVLAGALEILHDELARGVLHATVQCNVHHYEELTARSITRLDALEARVPGRIRLVKSIVSTDDYYAMMAAADIVVLPYRAADYVSRTSGIFAEALAAGKPVIVTAGTWMASQLERYGAGCTTGDASPEDLAAAVRGICSDYASYTARSRTGAGPWIGFHSGDNLLRMLDALWAGA